MISRDRQAQRTADCVGRGPQCRRAAASADRLCGLRHVSEVVYRHIRRQAWATGSRPLSLLDVGSRDLSIPLGWAARLLREGRELELTLACLDDNFDQPDQIDAARRQGIPVHTVRLGSLTAPLPGGFDLVTSIHVFHQLTPHQAFCQMQSLQCSTAGPLIICDYERSRLNRWVVKLAARLRSRDRLVRRAADDCIGNAYSLPEFKELALAALARPVTVERVFPCHLLLACDAQMVSAAVPAFA